MLLNAVKDVTMALGDLIHATKAASGKSLNDPAMTTLKESAKVSIQGSESNTVSFDSEGDWVAQLSNLLV